MTTRRFVLALAASAALAYLAGAHALALQLIRSSADPDNAPRISSSSLTSGTANSAYSETVQLQAGVGRTPMTWTVASGSLPTGLTVGSSTGTISGTPTAAGTYNFTLRVVDALGGANERAFSLTIAAGSGLDDSAVTCEDTHTAANLTLSTVQTLHNSGTVDDDDCIQLPSGSTTWTGALSVGSKRLTIYGQSTIACDASGDAADPVTCSHSAGTSLTCSGSTQGQEGSCFHIGQTTTDNKHVRVTRMSLTVSGGAGFSFGGDSDVTNFYRFDHNFVTSSSWEAVEVFGFGGIHPNVLFDENRLVNIAIHANGATDISEANVIWAQDPPKGTRVGIVYAEDNHFTATTDDVANQMDGNDGGRYVSRFNNIASGRQMWEVHSIQFDNRAMQWFEIYGNAGASPSSTFSGLAFVRGGSGVIFGNRQAASGNWQVGLTQDNVRSEESGGGSAGQCNGSSNWDQNTSGQSGYRCRDQIGAGKDSTLWSIGAAYNQTALPAYYWDNLRGGSAMPVSNQGLSTWILENRDYYLTNGSFNGTTGVGSGPIASRPSTCTTGVAYWATDEADWNLRVAGNDGQLYKCTSTNTWTLYYTPYTYPYPWPPS